MSDFTLTHESVEQLLDYNVLITKFESGYEQRRLKYDSPVIGWKFRSPALTLTGMQAYQTFLVGKKGALTSFTWTSPFDATEYNVRFNPNSFKVTYQQGHFRVEWEFTKVNL